MLRNVSVDSASMNSVCSFSSRASKLKSGHLSCFNLSAAHEIWVTPSSFRERRNPQTLSSALRAFEIVSPGKARRAGQVQSQDASGG